MHPLDDWLSPVENSEMLCCAVLKFISEIGLDHWKNMVSYYADLMSELVGILHVNVRSFSHCQSQT